MVAVFKVSRRSQNSVLNRKLYGEMKDVIEIIRKISTRKSMIYPLIVIQERIKKENCCLYRTV